MAHRIMEWRCPFHFSKAEYAISIEISDLDLCYFYTVNIGLLLRHSNYKVLVTGGAGFIGSNLCDALIDRGYFVKCLDNFSTGKIENISHLENHKLFRFIEGDIRDFETCKKACDGIDIVFHQAALGSVPRSIADPITSNNVNITGFINMLVAAKDSGVKRFIYAGSSSTYGDSTALPKVEENIGNPLSPYAVTKMVMEHYARVFHQVYGMDTIGLRYFNVFGQRQDPEGAYAAVIPKFVLLLMNGKSPIINGTGEYSRDFTYIDNVIEANLLSMTTSEQSALNQVYNVACGERTTLNEMVSLLKFFLSAKDEKIAHIPIIYGNSRAGDIPHSLASIDKAMELLSYKPLVNFREGLKKSVDWYYEHLK
jgi:UDP-N-acetylglucosamine 4-epimerase